MDKNIKKVCQNIRSGKFPEENIPQLFNHLANQYYLYAGVQLSMHYYSFYESYYDEEDTWSKEAKEMVSQVNTIIKDSIVKNPSGYDREAAIKRVDSIRRDIMKRMNILTAYTDIFQTYEYVLNRLEYRFKENTKPVDDTEFAKEILRYIFDTEDNLIINEKIKEIIGQLPIRMTKQKYFELLKESILAYMGADQSSLDTFLYMLRTSAMLYREEDMDTAYPGLWEKKDFLSGLEYKDITRENYDKAWNALQIATLTLETETTVYYSLQEIVNEVYVLLLCSAYQGMVDNNSDLAQKASFTVIKEISNIFILNDKKELPAELLDQFTVLEGVPEELQNEIDTLEDSLYEVKHNYKALTESLMLDRLLHVLLRSQSLLSNSLFIDLEDDKDNGTVDEEMIEKETEALEKELTQLFDQHDRVICRAVIANTISKMPVFFKNHSEVMDYVRYSLERCSDPYEKSACAEIINAIMAE
jgi:hypothetical protein